MTDREETVQPKSFRKFDWICATRDFKDLFQSEIVFHYLTKQTQSIFIGLKCLNTPWNMQSYYFPEVKITSLAGWSMRLFSDFVCDKELEKYPLLC